MKLIRISKKDSKTIKKKDVDADFLLNTIQENIPRVEEKLKEIKRMVLEKEKLDIDKFNNSVYSLYAAADIINDCGTRLKKFYK